MKIIDSIKSSDLKEILKWLKLYSDMKNKLGQRWEKLFKRELFNKHYLLVEYFSSLKEDTVIEESLKVYSKFFNIEPNKNEIILKKVDNINWWIRVYFDDNMVDVSFSRVEKILKK